MPVGRRDHAFQLCAGEGVGLGRDTDGSRTKSGTRRCHHVVSVGPQDGAFSSVSATNEREVPTDVQESNGKSSTSNVATDANAIEIVVQKEILSVAFLVDGEHVVGGGYEKKIRQ
jgi:hypothetical protein